MTITFQYIFQWTVKINFYKTSIPKCHVIIFYDELKNTTVYIYSIYQMTSSRLCFFLNENSFSWNRRSIRLNFYGAL